MKLNYRRGCGSNDLLMLTIFIFFFNCLAMQFCLTESLVHFTPNCRAVGQGRCGQSDETSGMHVTRSDLLP